MNGIPEIDESDYSYPIHMLGAASPTGLEEPVIDPVEQLRRCVEEVTGLKIVRPTKPRIGFLP